MTDRRHQKAIVQRKAIVTRRHSPLLIINQNLIRALIRITKEEGTFLEVTVTEREIKYAMSIT